MPLKPFSPVGILVLVIFGIGMLPITLEIQLEMGKFKPGIVDDVFGGRH